VRATVDRAKRAKTEWSADGLLCLQIESQLLPKDSHTVDSRVEVLLILYRRLTSVVDGLCTTFS